ncbi:MAG: sigma-70 family RNA polymerase sigma factor [Myxococcales bacterium]|nr:sigma-70 family RNA polymerase sigma factor [Myxococcales bacterium]MCB9714042.1 sigma-70 family RNA polymerase sigma factor [Myxococcales bacterium]
MARGLATFVRTTPRIPWTIRTKRRGLEATLAPRVFDHYRGWQLDMDEEARDRELLGRWVDGDERAGSLLIQRHFETLNRFFVNKAPESDRADLIQNTLLQCTQSVERFRGEARFCTYLLAIARNVLLHHYRTRGRKLDQLDPLTHSVVEASTAGLFTKLVGSRELRALLRALRQLPIDLQLVLELKYWERLTAVECGIVLDMSPNTVSSRVKRAKGMLTRMLDGDEGARESGSSEARSVDGWLDEMRNVLGGDPREILAEREQSEE